MSPYRLSLLGEMVLHDAKRAPVLSHSQRRPLAVLAIVAAAGRKGARREQVIELLWGDQPEERARASFNQTLYALRKALQSPQIIEGSTLLHASTDVLTCDLWALEDALAASDAEAALRADRGTFLDGVQLSQDGAFERWAESTRSNLAFRSARLFERAAVEADECGLLDVAVRIRTHIHERDPLDPSGAVLFMRALERAGDVSGAFAAISRHADLVRSQLDEAPHPEILQERQRLANRVANERGTTVAEATRAPKPGGPAERLDSDLTKSARVLEIPPARHPHRRTLVALGAVAALAVVAITALTRLASVGATTWDVRPSTGRPVHAATRVAVLYFDDHSENRDFVHIAEGLTEALIHELSGVPALSVVSRNGVKAFRHRDAPFDSIVDQLRVGSVIEGSTLVSDGRVRVTIQLIDASTGAHLMSRTLDRRIGDLVTLESAVATEAATMLRGRIGDMVRLRAVESETRDDVALDLVLRAERLQRDAADLATNVTPAAVRRAMTALSSADSLLALAARRDARWLRPIAARGWVAIALARLDGGVRDARLTAAGRSAEQALRLQSRSAEALELRGTVAWETQRNRSASLRDSTLAAQAESDLRASLDVDSTRASAWATLSQLLRWQGAVAEADLLARRALTADAYLDAAGDVIAQLYRSAMMLGRADSASAWCARGRHMLALDWRFRECELTLMHQSPETADPARAWAIVRELESMDPPAMARDLNRAYSPHYRRLAAATVSAFHGDHALAKDELVSAIDRTRADSTMRVDVLFSAAWVYLGLGLADSATAVLNRYITLRPQSRAAVLRDPLLRRHGIDSTRIDAVLPEGEARP